MTIDSGLTGVIFNLHWLPYYQNPAILAFTAHLDTYRHNTVSCFEILHALALVRNLGC